MLLEDEKESVNLRILRQAWRQLADHALACQSRYDPRLTDRLDRVSSDLLPHLVNLLDARHDCCVQDLEPIIDQLVRDRMFVWDTVSVRQNQEDMTDLVRMLIIVLEQVRHQLLAKGEWSETLTPPQMFG